MAKIIFHSISKALKKREDHTKSVKANYGMQDDPRYSIPEKSRVLR